MSDARFVNQKAVGSRVLPDEAIPLAEGDGRFLNDIYLPGMNHVIFCAASMPTLGSASSIHRKRALCPA